MNAITNNEFLINKCDECNKKFNSNITTSERLYTKIEIKDRKNNLKNSTQKSPIYSSSKKIIIFLNMIINKF